MDKSLPDTPTAVFLHGILGSRKNWGRYFTLLIFLASLKALVLTMTHPETQRIEFFTFELLVMPLFYCYTIHLYLTANLNT